MLAAGRGEAHPELPCRPSQRAYCHRQRVLEAGELQKSIGGVMVLFSQWVWIRTIECGSTHSKRS